MVLGSKNDKNRDQTKAKLRKIMITSFFSLLLSSIIVITLLDLSNYAGTMDDTQLGFNANIIKDYFSLMNGAELQYFLLANIVDYVFMISYGLFFYSTARLLSWNYQKNYLKVGIIFAWIGVLAAVFDGSENVFIISMSLNPSNFPSWLAIAHSTFASLKFLCMYLVVGFLVLAFFSNVVLIFSQKIKSHRIRAFKTIQ